MRPPLRAWRMPRVCFGHVDVTVLHGSDQDQVKATL